LKTFRQFCDTFEEKKSDEELKQLYKKYTALLPSWIIIFTFYSRKKNSPSYMRMNLGLLSCTVLRTWKKGKNKKMVLFIYYF
jgi:hypothetical protein